MNAPISLVDRILPPQIVKSKPTLKSMLDDAGITGGRGTVEQLAVLTKSECKGILSTLFPGIPLPDKHHEIMKLVVDKVKEARLLILPPPAPPKPAPVVKPPSKNSLNPRSFVPKPCACGCKTKGKPNMTRGGKWIPGHDARYRAIQNGGIKRLGPRPCACGCKGPDGKPAITKGGKWLPGHDAKHYSRLLREEREKAAKAAKKRSGR